MRVKSASGVDFRCRAQSDVQPTWTHAKRPTRSQSPTTDTYQPHLLIRFRVNRELRRTSIEKWYRVEGRKDYTMEAVHGEGKWGVKVVNGGKNGGIDSGPTCNLLILLNLWQAVG